MSLFSKSPLLGFVFFTAMLCPAVLCTPVAAQAVDLEALGIDADFELIDLGGTDLAEQGNLVGFGPGWTFTPLGGDFSDWGLQDPGAGFFDRVADLGDTDDLAAPFSGRQIGFINLQTEQSSGEVVSQSVGKLQANSNYTLTVAVGIRQNQAAWTVDYEIGLRTLAGVDLGTFAAINKTNGTLPEDLVYNLNIGGASPNIGQEVSIVIRNSNAAGDAFSQSAFDNVRLEGPLGAANTPFLTIERSTGAMTLSKTGTEAFDILGYSLKSDAGSLDDQGWSRVNGAWTVTSDAADDLSELNFADDVAVALGSGTPIGLGTPWIQTPFEDVEAELLLSNGSTMPVFVKYNGAEIPLGDLTGDGEINSADWGAFKNGQGTDFDGLLLAERYVLGDLDNDSDHDLNDFSLFQAAYDDANGEGSFAAMISGVPEPSSLVLLASAISASLFFRRKPVLARGLVGLANSLPTSGQTLGALCLAAALAVGGLLETQQVRAQVTGPIPLVNFSFQEPAKAGDGNPNDEDAFDVGNGNPPPTGWTLTSSINQNYGQQRPDPDAHFTRDVTGGELSPFTQGGFDGDIILFANLNSAGANLTADSSVAGQLLSGDYTLTVALGGRDTGSWNDLNYTISLVGSSTGVLGTPTAVTINPGNSDQNSTAPTNSPWTTDEYNVVDVSYSLNVPGGSGLIGEDFFVRITAENSGFHDGVADTDFTQAAIDNIRLVGPTVPTFGLYVDPDTGRMQIRNPSSVVSSDREIRSYRITSNNENLNAAGWASIASQTLGALPAGDGVNGNGWETGSNISDGELVEWYLQGTSTIADGAYVDLGNAFKLGQNPSELSFSYTDADGAVVSGLVFEQSIVDGDFDFDDDVDGDDLGTWESTYGDYRSSRDILNWLRNYGSGVSPSASPVAIPEPTSAALLFCGALGLVWRIRTSSKQEPTMNNAIWGTKTASLAFAILLSTAMTASAASTLDREYLFGDDNGEGASAEQPVGSGNGNGTTWDSSPIGGFQDLAPNGSGTATYVDVGPGGLNRPGASSGDLGIHLDGNSYLLGRRFNDPATAPGSTGAIAPHPVGAQDYAGITNRGFQLWVRPQEDSLGEGHEFFIVHDTTEHGVRIDDGDNSWHMIYDGGVHDSGVGLSSGGDSWYHVMVVRPFSGHNNVGGSLLYVNGVAIEGEGGPYDVTPTPGGDTEQYRLVIGADTGNGQSDLIDGDNDRFTGVVDDLKFFALGTTLNGLDLGTFNFAEDNDYAKLPPGLGGLTGVAGDVDQDGVLDPVDDVNALIAGWGSEKIVDGIHAGDLTTILNGDLNFDGRTNLADAFALHQALLTAGFSAGLDFSLLQQVPEPTSGALAGMVLAVLAGGVRRRGGVQSC